MKMKLWNLDSGTICFDNHICIILCIFIYFYFIVFSTVFVVVEEEI